MQRAALRASRKEARKTNIETSTKNRNSCDFTFKPSKEMIAEIISLYSEATIEEFENSPGFSSYKVSYRDGDKQGELIYKTTLQTYPLFQDYNSELEYRHSFRAHLYK
ncbi:MAG: hypothetical protein ACTHJ0_04325 [Flavipsychrobacter sp.]